jgi:SanA protein
MKRAVFFAAGFMVVLIGAANVIVWLGGRGPATRDVAEVPPAEAALVLGAQVYTNGKPSIMLADRVHAAEALYRAGKVKKILVSGDHGRWSYDEPGTMRKMLLADGIPARDIFTDHAGFDTWDSAQRARRVFDVRSAVVVTQRFHMARALFDARRAGLHVTGFIADRRGYGRVMYKLEAREAVARVKAVGDAVVGAGPKFLGAQIPITGDGRESWGPAGP